MFRFTTSNLHTFQYRIPCLLQYPLKCLLTFLSVVTLQLLSPTVNANSECKVDYQPTYFRDDNGRALILRGLNTSNRGKRGEQGLLADVSPLAVENYANHFGWNVVRLVIAWQYLEPAKDEIDQSYLQTLKDIIHWYSQHDVKIILDIHQDVLHGFPEWAQPDHSLPNFLGLGFPIGYFVDLPIIRGFNDFWTNKEGFLDEYREISKLVLVELGNLPGVIAFDLLNEPGWGFIPPPFFEERHYAPAMQDLINDLREINNDIYLGVEPPAITFSSTGLQTSLPDFLDPREEGKRIFFAPHVYPPLIDENIYPKLPFDPGYSFIDRFILKTVMNNIARYVADKSMPVFIGEYGVFRNAAIEDRPYLNDFFDHFASFANDCLGSPALGYWETGRLMTLEQQENPSAVRGIATEHLALPYPQKVAGDPLSLSYDRNTKELKFSWRETGIAAPTVFYIPEHLHYPNGWEVNLPSDGEANWRYSWDSTTHRLTLWADSSVETHHFTLKPRE